MQAADIVQLREIVISSARQVFPGCGIEIGDQREPVEEAPDTKRLVAFMGFSGGLLRGSLAVVAPVELMKRAYPLPLTGTGPWEIDVFDWSGEVANRLLGRIKNELAARGVEVEPSTPRVLHAERLHAVGSMRRMICSLSFMSRDSWIEVWFDAIVAHDRPFLTPVDPNRETPSEGDVLLFD